MPQRASSLAFLLALGACAGAEVGDSGTFGNSLGSTLTDPSAGPPDPSGDTDDGTDSAATGSASSNPSATDPSTTDPSETVTDSAESSGDPSEPGTEASTGTPGADCGNGIVEADEACDDGNGDDSDDCPASCQPAACGDGYVQANVEACDDGNASSDDGCIASCVVASCGDGFVFAGNEQCDDGNADNADACPSTCATASCGDGFVFAGVEQCDDGGAQAGDGCSAQCASECGNIGGGALVAENGVGNGVLYCYEANDSTEVRANKACESHFGVGACCLIPGGYSGLQYGQCGADGYAGTIHWHPDSHPDGHCEPFYVPGDVVAPGWCGVVTGSFLD